MPDSSPTPISPVVVLKFGGTSVSSAETWEVIARVLRTRLDAGERPLVVHSALAGVTDRLEALPAAAREDRHGPLLQELADRHDALARELGVDASSLLAADREELRRLAAGIALLGEVTPRIRARILAFGERMATRLGAAFLQERGLPVVWMDARELLVSLPAARGGGEGGNGSGPGAGAAAAHLASWLSAECSSEPDPALQERLGAIPGIPLTQGYTARNPAGETVVLGRGGSDTAAAYLAGKLGAERLEIWTDVPGMFTADPRLVPVARLIRRLDYREAQEIATTGSKVLHPRCIPAVRARGIPIRIHSTRDPEQEGTLITRSDDAGSSRVKAISRKTGVVLVSMETVGMWQEVGFLARAFDLFRQHGLSVDLVSTSETNVTVSLDAAANLLDRETLEGLTADLGRICRVSLVRPCAAVSLVGNRIRGLLHRLGPALEAFEEQRIHLVTQAASDLNLTVVVDEEQSEKMVRQLHALLISDSPAGDLLGPTWQQLQGREGGEAAVGAGREAAAGGAAGAQPSRWWERKRDALLEIGLREGAAYVYDLETVDRQLDRLGTLRPLSRVFYAMKANNNPDVLRRVRAAGTGLECVSQAEMERVFGLFPDLDPGEVLFTPNFAPREEYAWALERGVRVTLDALHPIQHWPELFRGRDLMVRVDPGWGKGHNEKVVTGGTHSKFGIPLFEMEELRERVVGAGATVVGLHTHSGSGILTPGHWARVAELLSRLSTDFPEVRILNVGGGLGVPERPGQEPLDMEAVARGLEGIHADHPELELWMEPGRFVVAEAGVLLARVNQTKGKGEVRYAGLATGMNSLIRPALYGAYHEIVNLTRIGEPATELTQVVGPICETGDRLGVDRLLPPTREGDILLVATAGAYGQVMASRYNLREPAVEVVLG